MAEVYYISGPMTGLPNLNREAFAAAADKIRTLGFEAVNPAETDPPGDPTWEECLRADIVDMLRCTRLALLPGWEQSRGATLEVHVAKALGMLCQPIDEIPAEFSYEDILTADTIGYERGVLEERARCVGIMNFVMHENSGLGLFTPAMCFEMLQDGRTLESVEAGKHYDMPCTPEPNSGAGVICAERLRQITEEGYDAAHDDRLVNGDLGRAAACYAAPDYIHIAGGEHSEYWPFPSSYDRRNSYVRNGGKLYSHVIRIRELAKAGALCAAEIDRLKRLEKSDG